MIRIAICDDEITDLNGMVSLIKEYKTEKKQEIHCTPFQSAMDLIETIEKGQYFDIIFLDIIMPLLNGMDAAKEIRQLDKNTNLVFFTTSTEFAVESYSVNAYYYALKPICKENFFPLLEKLVSQFHLQDNDKIVIKTNNQINCIMLSTLVYCEVIRKKIFYYLDDGTILESTDTMKKLEELLLHYPYFIKPHRSYIVNMKFITTLGRKEITTNYHMKIPVSRGNYEKAKVAYLDYCFERGFIDDKRFRIY